MDKSDIPKIVHKYISLFDNEEAYNAAFSNFEEVNWSAIKPSIGPEETPDKYRASRRLSNMYRKNNPPSYKFDDINDFVLGNKQIVEIQDDETKKLVIKETNIYADAAYIAKHNTNGNVINNFTPDVIRKTFFLEIVWGFFGWEGNDYKRVIGTDPETEEPIIETLIGGNLYKIKNIQTVPHIIDGYRLQHINDFLFSQYNVIKVEGFNTSNLIAANRAFKRGTNNDVNYPIRSWNDILECHLVDGYNADGSFGNHPFGYADLVTGESLLDNLVEADGLFYNNKIYIHEGNSINSIPITIPNITHIDRLYSYGAFTDNLKFKFPNITKLTNTFKAAIFTQGVIDLNQIFVDGTLDNLVTFSSIFGGSSFTYTDGDNHNVTTVKLDLTSSNVPAGTEIDMSHFLEVVGPREGGNANLIIANSVLNIDLNFNKKVNLSYAFANIAREKSFSYDGIQYYRNGGFETINLDINGKEAYVNNLDYAFINNVLITALPIAALPNAGCSDNYIYKGCTFNHAITYDFSPTQVEHDSYGQFNDSIINDSFTFSHLNYLNRAEFCNIRFNNNIGRAFPYTIQRDTTPRYVDLCRSQFTSIPNQSIYIDTDWMATAEDRYRIQNSGEIMPGDVCPFQSCEQIDFDNVHLYYSVPTYTGRIRLVFTKNFVMTNTPHAHINLHRNSNLNFYIECSKLENIINANFEDCSFSGTNFDYGEPVCSFKDCINLVYLKIGTATNDGFEGGLDIRGCHYEVSPGVWDTHLDIPTLEATLLSMKRGTLRIMFSAWNKLSSATQAYCNSHFSLLQVRDNEYDPNA